MILSIRSPRPPHVVSCLFARHETYAKHADTHWETEWRRECTIRTNCIADEVSRNFLIGKWLKHTTIHRRYSWLLRTEVGTQNQKFTRATLTQRRVCIELTVWRAKLGDRSVCVCVCVSTMSYERTTCHVWPVPSNDVGSACFGEHHKNPKVEFRVKITIFR